MRFRSISTLVTVEQEIYVFTDRSYMVNYGQNVNSIKYVLSEIFLKNQFYYLVESIMG